MIHILECLSCCVSGRQPSRPEKRPSEEKVPLAPHPYTPSATTQRRRFRRKRLRSCSSLDDWKPTLDAIYEDDDIDVVERNSRSIIRSETVQKKKKVNHIPHRTQVRDHTGNHRPLRLGDVLLGYSEAMP